MVVQFETSFDNLPAGIETITPAHESDGRWRVAGYFIKHAPDVAAESANSIAVDGSNTV